MSKARRFIEKTLVLNGVRPESLKFISSKKKFSNFDEEFLIKQYIDSIPDRYKEHFVVDIAAADGVSMSNTYALYRAGIPGLAVEFDGELFSQLAQTYRHLQHVNLLRAKVTPETVVDILKGCSTPKQFSLLNLDIDGYDYFVLQALLKEYRPAVICAEINEKIPPPLKFTVKYSPDYSWGTNHFFGQSISQLHLLCKEFGYDLVELHYNNAFLIPKEANTHPALSPEEAYDQGYRFKADRIQKFSYNADMDAVLDMPPEQAKQFIEEAFKKYTGQFELTI